MVAPVSNSMWADDIREPYGGRERGQKRFLSGWVRPRAWCSSRARRSPTVRSQRPDAVAQLVDRSSADGSALGHQHEAALLSAAARLAPRRTARASSSVTDGSRRCRTPSRWGRACAAGPSGLRDRRASLRAPLIRLPRAGRRDPSRHARPTRRTRLDETTLMEIARVAGGSTGAPRPPVSSRSLRHHRRAGEWRAARESAGPLRGAHGAGLGRNLLLLAGGLSSACGPEDPVGREGGTRFRQPRPVASLPAACVALLQRGAAGPNSPPSPRRAISSGGSRPSPNRGVTPRDWRLRWRLRALTSPWRCRRRASPAGL